MSDMVDAVLCHGHVWLPMELSLVFIDDVTADRRNKMNSEMYRALLSAQIELIGWCFTAQTQELLKAKKCSILQ